jgi:hypothetical protein
MRNCFFIILPINILKSRNFRVLQIYPLKQNLVLRFGERRNKK